jgi:CheY-like chemotaxis protein
MTPAAVTPLLLVVDDEPALATVLQRMLVRSFPDYEVRSVGDADAALAITAQEAGRLRLVLTDLGLPGMDGGQLATAIKAHTPCVRVVVMSGKVTDWQTSIGPIDGTLPKPSSREQLEQVVRAALAPN